VPLPRHGELNGRGLTTAALADRLRERLEELDAEAVVIARALAALDGGSYRRVRRPGSQNRTRAPVAPRDRANVKRVGHPARDELAVDARVLEALRDSLGGRASMLALTSGLSIETVRRSLESLERCGRARRDGLGWRAADS
jgi:hypothetical protein